MKKTLKKSSKSTLEPEQYNHFLVCSVILGLGGLVYFLFAPEAAWGVFVGICAGIVLRRDFMR